MREYIIQAGDSLSSIAQQFLGSSGKWRLIAEANHISNPDRIKVGQKLLIPSSGGTEVPAVTNPSLPPPGVGNQRVAFSEEGKKVFAVIAGSAQKILLGNRFRLGLSRHGLHEPEDFIARAAGLLSASSLSESEVNVMLSTSENEGALDALNTWDNSFLSFGMFQWTSGRQNQEGELPALLAIIKQRFPEEFQNYWGQFGLDVVDTGPKTGWFSLDGRKLMTADEKNVLRDYAWVFRFVRAGEDAEVQAVQIMHAVNRLDQFYFRRQPKLNNLPLSSLITSEFGVALLLDHHVNRPGYVVGTVQQAIADISVTPSQLASGSDDLERRVLERYIEVRATFGKTPMTHALKRAEVSRRFVTEGVTSQRRGTFKSNREQRS